jgi:hypothetical protein
MRGSQAKKKAKTCGTVLHTACMGLSSQQERLAAETCEDTSAGSRVSGSLKPCLQGNFTKYEHGCGEEKAYRYKDSGRGLQETS